MRRQKVLVLSGGFSAEREVSLVSGKGVSKALRAKGYSVIEHDLRSGSELFKILQDEKPDVVFNALHGNFGEDGAIQGFLDLLQIPYTHSSMTASLFGMNKTVSKMFAGLCGVQTAPFEVLTYKQYKSNGSKLEYPYVVKPVSDGSSVGVFMVFGPNDEQNVFYADENSEIMVEKYIQGRELTVSVIDGKAVAVTELKPKSGFYDYKAKYTPNMTTHVLPADIDQNVYQCAMTAAEKIHRILKCGLISRSDFRYNEKDGVVFLEINTNPGMTDLSLVPEQAKFAGLSYEDLCEQLVENATCRKTESSS